MSKELDKEGFTDCGIVVSNSLDEYIISEKDDVIIIVDNSYSKKVDLEKLGSKNYSTKGEGRGLGLYIIKNLLKTSKCIILEQTANNKIFTSKITVKQN